MTIVGLVTKGLNQDIAAYSDNPVLSSVNTIFVREHGKWNRPGTVLQPDDDPLLGMCQSEPKYNHDLKLQKIDNPDAHHMFALEAFMRGC